MLRMAFGNSKKRGIAEAIYKLAEEASMKYRYYFILVVLSVLFLRRQTILFLIYMSELSKHVNNSNY